MPCALPPVDQSSSQLGWGHGVFHIRTEPGRPRQAPVFHSGIDFMADAGSPVVAPWPGTVIATGMQPYGDTPVLGADALGHYVVISHGVIEVGRGPLVTRYAHLRSASALRVGDRVAQGDLIGYVGSSGRAPERRERPLLFFQVLRDIPTNWTLGMGVPVDEMADFFIPLGVTHEGGQRPGPTVAPYAQVPVWGGQLVQQSSCEGGGVRGLGSLDPRAQRARYSRFGSTQLSDSTPYAPARYAVAPSESTGGALFLGLGLALGAWWLVRSKKPAPAAKAPPWWVRQQRWKRA